MDMPLWVDTAIRTRGDYAGLYRIRFDPGCPLDRLTAVQVKKLAALLHEFDTAI